MKELPKFVKSCLVTEEGDKTVVTIVLHTKQLNKPYNRLSHLIVKDWVTTRFNKQIDMDTFDGPNVITNKKGESTGVWSFKFLTEEKTKKKTKKKKTKKTAKKEEKELDNYEEMTYPLPSKD